MAQSCPYVCREWDKGSGCLEGGDEPDKDRLLRLTW
jgi:hypothetical protein